MKRWLYLVLIACLGLACLLTIDSYYRRQIAQENNDQLKTSTLATQRELENSLQIRLVAVNDLQAFMLATDELPNYTTFDRFSAQLLKHYPIVRTVQYISPELVIEHTYPLEDNEVVIGLDLSNHPTAPVALKAIEERRLVVTDPLIIAQGTLAIIARIDLHHDDELVGLVAGVFDIEPILHEISTDIEGDFVICLEDNNGEVFWGTENLKNSTQSAHVAVADKTWTLTMGWKNGPPKPNNLTLNLIWLGGLPFLFSVLFLTNSAMTRYEWLNRNVEEKTQALENQNQVLEKEIAERKLIERELRLSHEILKQSPSAIILTDKIGIVQRWMGSAEELLGYSADEMIGQSIHRIRMPHQRESFSAQILDTVQREGQFVAEIQAITKKQNYIHIETAISALHDAEGEFTALIGINKDISARHQAELLRNERANLALQLEKEKELTQFRSRLISIISHEFRTPLTVIQNSSTLLVDYEDRLTPQKRHARIRSIMAQAERLAKMLDDIDILLKSQRGFLQYDPQLINIVEFGEQLYTELKQIMHDNHEFIFSQQGRFPLVSVDRELMRHALTNLISNAVKYSKDGGKIIMEFISEADRIRINVHDEGMGIPPEEGEELFEPFQRAHNVGNIRGTGLGLSLVKDIVELHGGKINFESSLGKGTVFKIQIPLQNVRSVPIKPIDLEVD